MEGVRYLLISADECRCCRPDVMAKGASGAADDGFLRYESETIRDSEDAENVGIVLNGTA